MANGEPVLTAVGLYQSCVSGSFPGRSDTFEQLRISMADAMRMHTVYQVWFIVVVHDILYQMLNNGTSF